MTDQEFRALMGVLRDGREQLRRIAEALEAANRADPVALIQRALEDQANRADDLPLQVDVPEDERWRLR